MFHTNCILKANDTERDVGLVYKDAALSEVPAAHVFIIGVGDYKATDKFKKPLTSTTISARAVGDWFLTDATPCFQNQKTPLASLAILLSEPIAESIYAGGVVPRATLEATKKAIRAWVTRINSHRDNLAILYVASHGQSFLSRTGVQLEDYGIDPLDETSGMFEVEQLVSALENANPVSQLLLFDCCRTPISAELPWNTQLGATLISLRRMPGDHGETRQQCVICATSLGELAGGWIGGKTLFAEALMRSLNGVASDTTVANWPVRPGHLIDKIGRFLEMYRRTDEMPQTPSGRAALFDITYAGELDQIPVFVTLDDPENWLDSRLTMTANGVVAPVLRATRPTPPFYDLEFPVLTNLHADAQDKSGAVLGSAKGKVYPPALFLKISKTIPSEPEVVGSLPAGRSITAVAEIQIYVKSPIVLDAGAVVEIVNRDAKELSKQHTVSLGRETSVEVTPGQYSLTLRTPDGRVQTRDVTLADNAVVRVEFSTQDSPHEWLAAAAVAGAIQIPSDEPPSGTTKYETFVPFPVIATVAGRVDCNLIVKPLEPSGQKPPMISREIHVDKRFTRFTIEDYEHGAFMSGYAGPNTWLMFARIETPELVELAAIPSPGRLIYHPQTSWTPFLLVDSQTELGRSRTTAIIESSEWSGLLGFLASRDIASGIKILNDKLEGAAFYALQHKTANPLAAAAGGLVLVSAFQTGDQMQWDPWLTNLANLFPGLPDGPIILGRRLMIRARTEADIAEARKWFFEGFDRGVPLYSLSVDWLARGLESIPGDDAELATRRQAARRLASRVDPTRTFTVIHIEQ